MKKEVGKKVQQKAAGTVTEEKLELPSRNDLHVLRKIFHFVWGYLFALSYQFYFKDRKLMVSFLSMIWLTILFGEIMRHSSDQFQRFAMKFFGPFMRSHEVKQYSGILYYISGIMFVTYFLPKPIAIISILFLSCGDPMASVFGILVPLPSLRLKNGKSLAGTFACFVTCLLLGSYIVFNSGFNDPIIAHNDESYKIKLFLFVLSGAIAAASAEASVATPRPYGVDDNLIIPVVTGITLYIATFVLGIPTQNIDLF